MRLIMNNEMNILEEFFTLSYKLLEENDAAKIEEIKYVLIKSKIIAQTEKHMIKNLLFSYFSHIYYLIINNPVYLEVNKENIKMLLEELKILSFLKKFFPNLQNIENNQLLSLYIQILESLNQIDLIRTSYQEENANIGRKIASRYHLQNLKCQLEKQAELKEQVIKTLELKES